MIAHSTSRLGALALALFLAGCEGQVETAAEEQPPPLVTVIKVEPETVVIADDLPGRVAAFRTAEIRPQVGGIIEKRWFIEGSEVAAGQDLFQIALAPFKADVDAAAAALQRSEAGLVRVEAKFARAAMLVDSKAISRESYDDAAADVAQAKASVAEARATLQRRRLDLDFATVKAPIAGRIGQALVGEGALVSTTGTAALAVVQQIDRVYVDVRQPASQLDVIRAGARSGELPDGSKAPVALLGASGEPYPVTGRALFSDISVDPGTGNVMVRVEVANPDRLLLPGMYVRARLPRGVRHDALLVPQEAVTRDLTGRPQLVIVDAEKHGIRRDVETGETIAGRAIITRGLSAGETVVVQGHDRVQDGVPLDVRPFSATSAQN